MKKKVGVLLLATSLIFCSSCDKSEIATKQQENSILVTVEACGTYKILRDIETGVMYLRYNQDGIIPMFNADGSLKIWQEGE